VSGPPWRARARDLGEQSNGGEEEGMSAENHCRPRRLIERERESCNSLALQRQMLRPVCTLHIRLYNRPPRRGLPATTYSRSRQRSAAPNKVRDDSGSGTVTTVPSWPSPDGEFDARKGRRQHVRGRGGRENTSGDITASRRVVSTCRRSGYRGNPSAERRLTDNFRIAQKHAQRRSRGHNPWTSGSMVVRRSIGES